MNDRHWIENMLKLIHTLHNTILTQNEEIEKLKRREFICKQCGLRKDIIGIKGDSRSSK